MESTLSVLLYAGLAGSIGGAVLWMFRAWRSKPTGPAAKIAIAGNFALAAALVWPPATFLAATPPASELDIIVPVWQFGEFHEIEIAATPEEIDRSIREVTAGEIRFFEALTAIRRGGKRGAADILHAPEASPILATALKGGFMMLSDAPSREIVLGTVVIKPSGLRLTEDEVRRLSIPQIARAVMNFRIEPLPGDGRGHRLTTETRVHATDSLTARKFSWYWRLIYPGSSLIRAGWLEAIRKRAEAAAG